MFKLSVTLLTFLLNVENGLAYVPAPVLSNNLQQQQQQYSLNSPQLSFVVSSSGVNKDRFTILKSTEEAINESSTTSEEEEEEEASSDDVKEEPAATTTDEDNIMKLYLGSLPTNYGQNEIREMLQPYLSDESSMMNINVPLDRMTGLPRGFAFVEMEKEGASKAISELTGTEIDGQAIRINEQLSKEELLAQRAAAAAAREAAEAGTKLYCGNISFETSKELLTEEFEKFGVVNDVFMPIDTRTGFKRGFAFIRMENEEGAQAAIEGLNGVTLDGRPIEVNLSLPRGQAPPKRRRESNMAPRTKIYIGNLPFDTTPDSLSTIFYNYGTVLDCYLPTDIDTGASRGFGFITMPADDAEKAIEELDGIEFDGRELRINVAQPKGRPPPRDDYDAGY